MMIFLRKLGILALFIAAVFGSGFGVSKAKGQTLCNMPLSGLMACQPAVTGSNPPKPTAECCTALSQANMTCLCTYKSSLPSSIDPKKAMALPTKCNLKVPAKC